MDTEHDARNIAQADADRAELFDAQFDVPEEHHCAVSECEQPGAEEYRVCPRGICDPGEEERWPVVRFCARHMAEIMRSTEP